MSSEQIGTQRSDFLVHWTGKCIQKDYRFLSCQHRITYKNRLLDILSNGLWMNRGKEEIAVSGLYKLSYIDAPMTCFTEIKLSTIERHTQLYGCLGFGFRREFILDLLGAPVHYVAGTDNDMVFGDLHMLQAKIEELRPQCGDSTVDELCTLMKPSILFLKNMSDCKEPHDFRFLDEAEWRIMYIGSENVTDEKQRNIVPPGLSSDRVPKIRFGPADLKVLIFPDHETRRMALEDDSIFGWFGRDIPIIATVAECMQF